jgi:hypothetical protein
LGCAGYEPFALPVAGMLRRLRWAAALSLVILLECGVLAVNGGRCPLSDLAARYTDERASNFDIYLPNWLASHNKAIFGMLFVVNELIVLWCHSRAAEQGLPAIVPLQSPIHLAVEGRLKSGLGGEHTESNHRLMYTSAWASPQKFLAPPASAASEFQRWTESWESPH